ncbi:MAG TPA: cell division protein FtsL [Halothiobacillaceae bacterium]|nr:cell division protein FtsL [Halothiobacillaceae bacterium]
MRIVIGILVIAVFASSIFQIKLSTESRAISQQMAEQRVAIERLESTFAELQLEEGTLAAQGRIERIATEELGLIHPQPEQVEVLFR